MTNNYTLPLTGPVLSYENIQFKEVFKVYLFITSQPKAELHYTSYIIQRLQNLLYFHSYWTDCILIHICLFV